MLFIPTLTIHPPQLPLENMEALAASRLSWIAGYNVEEHDWVTFPGLDSNHAEYDQDAWRKLVKDQHTKDLIQSIADTTSPQPAQARKGMNVLLSGGPATGKKTAAYAVCNLLKRPMLSIYANDIPYIKDVQPWAAELASLAIKWNAVVVVERAYYFFRSSTPSLQARINVVLQEFESSGCICLWPSVLRQGNREWLRPFFAEFNFPDLDRAARHQRWLQHFGKDETVATLSGSEDMLDSTVGNMESSTFLREIEKLSWYELDGTEIKYLMDCARDMVKGKDPSPQDIKACMKATGLRLPLRRKVSRFWALWAMDHPKRCPSSPEQSEDAVSV